MVLFHLLQAVRKQKREWVHDLNRGDCPPIHNLIRIHTCDTLMAIIKNFSDLEGKKMAAHHQALREWFKLDPVHAMKRTLDLLRNGEKANAMRHLTRWIEKAEKRVRPA